MTHRAGRSPAVVSTASPRPIGARSSLSRTSASPAARGDRAGHAAAVQQPRVRRVGDRVDLERRDVGVEDLDHAGSIRSVVATTGGVSIASVGPGQWRPYFLT